MDRELKRRDGEGSCSVLRDERGAVYTEYTVVLVFVSLVVLAAVAALGVVLLDYYRDMQSTISSPIP